MAIILYGCNKSLTIVQDRCQLKSWKNYCKKLTFLFCPRVACFSELQYFCQLFKVFCQPLSWQLLWPKSYIAVINHWQLSKTDVNSKVDKSTVKSWRFFCALEWPDFQSYSAFSNFFQFLLTFELTAIMNNILYCCNKLLKIVHKTFQLQSWQNDCKKLTFLLCPRMAWFSELQYFFQLFPVFCQCLSW